MAAAINAATGSVKRFFFGGLGFIGFWGLRMYEMAQNGGLGGLDYRLVCWNSCGSDCVLTLVAAAFVRSSTCKNVQHPVLVAPGPQLKP